MMDSDVLMVIGVIAAALSVPSLISAFSESRPPRMAAFLIVLAGGLIIAALYQKPGGYRIEDIPNSFVRVFGMITR